MARCALALCDREFPEKVSLRIEPAILSNRENNQCSLSIFCNENWLRGFFCESRDFIRSIPQIRDRLNNWHAQDIITILSTAKRLQMLISSSKKRVGLLKRTAVRAFPIEIVAPIANVPSRRSSAMRLPPSSTTAITPPDALFSFA